MPRAVKRTIRPGVFRTDALALNRHLAECPARALSLPPCHCHTFHNEGLGTRETFPIHSLIRVI